MRSLVLILMVALAASCSKKESSDGWPEMDAYHTIMADCYHPLKDNGDLGPAKANAEALAAEADKWEQADLPDKVNNDDMEGLLATLKTDSRAFADQVKSNAPDSVLSVSLENLHNKFHTITEMWYGGAAEHHH